MSSSAARRSAFSSVDAFTIPTPPYAAVCTAHITLYRVHTRILSVVAALAVTLVLATPAGATTPKVKKCLTSTARGAHEPGWPCKPFVNRARVVKWAKATLIYNGFRPNVQLVTTTSRQIRLKGVQDGLEYIVNVARSGPRQLAVGLVPLGFSGGGTYTFDVGFDV